jgi:hypothetical protein
VPGGVSISSTSSAPQAVVCSSCTWYVGSGVIDAEPHGWLQSRLRPLDKTHVARAHYHGAEGDSRLTASSLGSPAPRVSSSASGPQTGRPSSMVRRCNGIDIDGSACQLFGRATTAHAAAPTVTQTCHHTRTRTDTATIPVLAVMGRARPRPEDRHGVHAQRVCARAPD